MNDTAPTVVEPTMGIYREGGLPTRGRPGAYWHKRPDGQVDIFYTITRAAEYLGIDRKQLIALQKRHPTELTLYSFLNSPHVYKRSDLDAAKVNYFKPVEVPQIAEG